MIHNHVYIKLIPKEKSVLITVGTERIPSYYIYISMDNFNETNHFLVFLIFSKHVSLESFPELTF